MAYNDFPVNIPGRLKSAAVGGVVADAEDIYDDVLGKSQHAINSETEGRLDGQDTKIDRKLAEIDTKYEDFEERTDELFEQERVDNRNAINEATSSIRANDTIVVEDHTAVAAPEANKIYREYGETSYADWQYQNNAWVKLAEYNHGVDDEPTAGSDNLVKSGGVKAQITQINDKLIKLVGWGTSYTVLQNVGDVMYLSSAKLLKKKITEGGSVETVPYYDGAIYTYNNKLYVWNGTDLVLANNTDLIPILNDKLIKLVGMGTASSGTSGVTAVGDIFYNNVAKVLHKVVTYTSPTSFTTETVPFYDGAIYTFNNELYVWNGTDLVLNDIDNTNFRISATKKLKEIQTNFDTPIIEIGSLSRSGDEVFYANRARTVYLKAPFKVQLSANRQFLIGVKYTVQSNGELVYDSIDSTLDAKSTCSKDEGIWRLVMCKSDNTDITLSELTGLVESYQGTLDFVLEEQHDIITKNLNNASLWELGYYNSSGNKVASDQRVRTKDRIDNKVNYIQVATGVQYCLIGWDASGAFKKFWDGGKFQDTGILLSGDIDISTIRLQNPGYTFALFGVADNVANYAVNFVFLNQIYKTNVNIDRFKEDEYNRESLWVRARLNSSGALVESTNRIATKNFIDKSIDVAYLTHVYPYYPLAFVAAYNADGSYVGLVHSSDLSIASSVSEFEITIPLREIHQKYPSYLFRIVLHENTNNDITTEYYSQCQFKNLLQARMDRIEYNKPMITFIDDDGMSEQFDNWKLIYDACGICPTMALVTVGLTQEDIAKVKQYGGLGFEFVSHSHGHSDLTTRTEEQLIADFRATTAALRDLGIKTANPSILVYPYNHVNDLVESVARNYFQCGIEGGEHRVNGKPLDRFHIRRESMLSTTRRKEVVIEGETVEVAIPKNLEEWEPFIDDLVAKNGWLVIMSHFRNSYAQDHYYFDESYIQPVVDLCQYAISRGCEILTAGAAFEKFKNKLEIGKVTDEHHYIVDCNGKVYDTME